jgi:hypothetical protein
VKVEQEIISFDFYFFHHSFQVDIDKSENLEGEMFLRGIFLESLPRSSHFSKTTLSKMCFSVGKSTLAMSSVTRKNGKLLLLSGISITCTVYCGISKGKSIAACDSSQMVLQRRHVNEDEVCTVDSSSPLLEEHNEMQGFSVFSFWNRLFHSFSQTVSSLSLYFSYLNRILNYFFYAFPLGVLLPANYMLGHQFPSLENITWSYFTFAIQSLGPCFIKLAQWASTRPDLFPLPLISHLESLQDRVKFVQSREMIERTLSEAFHDENGNGNWRKSLISIDYDHPLGTGSVAQVFKGTLRREITNTSSKGSSNRHVTSSETIPVAIKMIHPHVEKLIMIDMALLEIFADFLDRFPSLEILSIGRLV